MVLGLALLARVGAVCQAVATGGAQRARPAPGAMFDIGGYRMHIARTGEGGPTVVLDAALGNMSAHWAWLQQEVARTTRVCATSAAIVDVVEAVRDRRNPVPAAAVTQPAAARHR